MCKGISQKIIIGGNRYDLVIKLVKFRPTCLSIWVMLKKLQCKNKHNNNFFEKQIYFVIENILILNLFHSKKTFQNFTSW